METSRSDVPPLEVFVSIVVVVRMKADPSKVAALLAQRSDELEQVTADAKAAGGLSHRFLARDGEVLILDEWPDAPSFQAFFGTNKTITQLMMEAGVTERPTMEFYDTMNAAGTY